MESEYARKKAWCPWEVPPSNAGAFGSLQQQHVPMIKHSADAIPSFKDWFEMTMCHSPLPDDLILNNQVGWGFSQTLPIVPMMFEGSRPCIIATAEVQLLLRLTGSPTGPRRAYCAFSFGSLLMAKARLPRGYNTPALAAKWPF